MNFREFLKSLRPRLVAENESDIQEPHGEGEDRRGRMAPTRPILDRVVCNPDDRDLVARIIYEVNPWEVHVETSTLVPPLHVAVVWRDRGRVERNERYHL